MTLSEMYIRMDGLKFYAFHGVHPQEAHVGAEFTINLRLKTDFRGAAQTDELDGTVNYALVYEAVKAEMNIPSQLLEHVAYRIANRLFREFGLLTEIKIELFKQNPPIGADEKSIGIEAVFGREQ